MKSDTPQTTKLASKELYSRLLHYVKPHWKMFAVSIFSTVLLAATEPLLPMLMKPLLDGSFVDKNPENIKLMPVLLIFLFLARGIAGLISTVAINWVSTRLVMDIRRDMFERILSLPNNYFDQQSTGSIASTITYTVNQVASGCTNALIIGVRDSVAILGLLAWMFYLDWKLSLIFFFLVPLAGLIMKMVSLRLRRLGTGVQDGMGEITHVMEETIRGNRVIKIFGGQDYEQERFHKATNAVRRFMMKFTTTSAVTTPIIEMLAAFALAYIIYIASLQAAEGNITVGGFVSLFIAMAMLFGPAKRLTKVNENIQRALAAAESIFELIDETPENIKGSKSAGVAKGSIEFKHVSYQYSSGDEPAISDINLQINEGETIALVGKSGSGKTTLANMIPRFYVPTDGSILLDGTDINDLDIMSLRSNMALVSQDVVLFDDTISNNIAYGLMQKQFTENEIKQAAIAAHAMEFINAMPDGMNTQIGENGTKLSGGQRQRIAIARAILKDAAVLILDEATSALDSQSERHVQEALENLKYGRTTIIIAHRLSTIKNADRIIVMDKGKIAESGTHQELLGLNGIYTKLQKLQT
ncbi:MAG: lipid A export permease/ATP-binding protein MsbA [Gammaproteobacteria bacterium]|nr:lipid A export permease/ATP-binding protein MsbA [Gammaproteobacteria bacterium]